jgi:serine/threonine protein kinase
MDSEVAEHEMGERQIGQYILESKLGEGGMAEVWKARHKLLGTHVAIKFLTNQLACMADVEERFLSEGKRQANLAHPNIVSAFDFLQIDGRSYLIMKFVEGEGLDELMFRLQSPVPLPQSLSIATDVLHGLGYAHSKYVIHRDIKPSNILVETGGRALIMDFGVAMVMGEKRVTRVGVAVGTPYYMSPEQILGNRQIDGRTDIYSFGCVLYQMLTGKAPFEVEDGEGDTEYAIQEKHVKQPPVPPRQWNPYIPENIEQVVLRCLAKNASDRFSSCQDVLTALTSEVAVAKPPVEPIRLDTIIEIPAKPEAATPPPLPPRPVPASTPVPPPPERPITIATPIPDPPAAVVKDPAPVQPRGDNSLLWILCTVVISASLISGVYYYFHRHQGVTPAPIVSPVPPQTGPQGVTPPKPSPAPEETKPDDNPPTPVNPPQPDNQTPPAQPGPDKPVEPPPSIPTPEQQKPSLPEIPTPTPVQPAPTPSSTPTVSTPKISPPARQVASEGNLVWSGVVDKNQVIQISGSNANIGSIAGDPFPGGGVPIQISINNNKFAVISQPNPLNQFSQVSLRSTMKGNVVVVIHWKVLPSE